ncbi:MAG: hypothetical protein ACRC8Y_21820, partial [Chroococcales cyanobacterium]
HQAREQQVVAQQQLNEIDRSLQGALEKQAVTEEQLNQTQGELTQTQTQLRGIQSDFQNARTELSVIEGKFDGAQTQLEQVSQQAQQLRNDIAALQVERQELIEQGEQVRARIVQRDRELALKQAEIEEQRQEAAQQRQLLGQQSNQLEEQIRQLAQQQQQIAVQEGDIAQQQAQMAEQAAEIAQQKQAIAIQERELVQQKQAIAIQERELVQQEQEIARQEMEIARQQQAIALQEEEIAQRDRQISEQEVAISEQRTLLKELGTQQAFLQREVQSLERDFQLLREGTVAIRRNQVLASGVLRVLRPETAPEATEQLLKEANLAAITLIRPGTTQLNEWAIAITDAELDQLIDQIDDGQDYVVRILSAANYLLGERQVNVFADAVPNQVVFNAGELVATTSVRPSRMSEDEIKEQLNLLLAAANFRARRSGIVTDAIQVGDGRMAALLEFIQQLPDNNEPGIIQAISARQTYTSGPLTLEFKVVHKGKVVFPTD